MGLWGAGALGAGAAGLGWHGSGAAPTRLAWSGAQWAVPAAGQADETVAPPQVLLDLGGWLLMRTRPLERGRSRWLSLSRADAGPAWHLLRAAVYSCASGLAPRSAAERPPF